MAARRALMSGAERRMGRAGGPGLASRRSAKSTRSASSATWRGARRAPRAPPRDAAGQRLFRVPAADQSALGVAEGAAPRPGSDRRATRGPGHRASRHQHAGPDLSDVEAVSAERPQENGEGQRDPAGAGR